MPYIHFTEEQKRQAASVDLEEFLLRQGETLLPSGREKRLASNHSVTIRGNEWYDHAAKEGGGPVSFLQKFCSLSYPEAMTQLLNGHAGGLPTAPPKREEKPQFQLPPRNDTMRRVYAYLLKQRLIDRTVLDDFVHNKLIYESREPLKTGGTCYNAVFVGLDENGIPRHAHKRGLFDVGAGFKRNVAGCDARYSFHRTGSGDRLYVFEAPIDLLSFLSLRHGEQEQNCVALCGTAEHAMLWMLEQNPQIQNIFLCLDHDEAGIEAAGRLAELLHQRGYASVAVLQPEYKDWNKELKAAHGLPALPAEEHPQLIAAPDICQFIAEKSESAKLDSLESEFSGLFSIFQNYIRRGQSTKAVEYAENLSALALAAYGRELRQMGDSIGNEEMASRVCERILPHQNRTALKNRPRELETKMNAVLAQWKKPGVRSVEAKQSIAESWLNLAAEFAKVSVKYEAEIIKQRQNQSPTLQMEMT